MQTYAQLFGFNKKLLFFFKNCLTPHQPQKHLSGILTHSRGVK
ncbi:hypothetical protein FLA_3270 [Filimonas lacunae]|nr:hypothetical protein FLA_3270 [Filimonas lacunae]